MSFGCRLGSGECRLEVGQVHANGLAERFEEHRRITAIDGDRLSFIVVFGRRLGNAGACKVNSFWVWSRELRAEKVTFA